MKPAKKLEKARRNRTFVEIERSPRHADIVWGYVVATGKKWALIAAARDGGYPDGLVAIRIKDVLDVARERSFQRRFAATRHDWPDAPDALDLDSTGGLLRSAGSLFPLVGIERERHLCDAKWIGVPVHVDEDWTWLHEIDPRARWHKRSLAYRTRSITCVTLDDAYQHALAELMPERPPQWVKRTKKSRRKD